MPLSRRQFMAATLAGAAGGVPMLRGLLAAPLAPDGRLRARPQQVSTPIDAGLHTLDVGGSRETVLFVPASYRPARPAPFALMLHGATGSSAGPIRFSREAAERAGIVLLVPSSSDYTWDAIRGAFGVDLALIDRALTSAFKQVSVEPSRVAVGGFSDGASYALSLGVINGDLFTHAIGYSAGFIIPGARHGRAKFFLSHGRQDSILPIDQCGRRIAANLKADGFDVRLEEFEGNHEIPPAIVNTATSWFVG
jgi:phospholipase/carboxylesterase